MKIKGFWDDFSIDEDCNNCGFHSKCKNPFHKVYGEELEEAIKKINDELR